MNILRSLYKFNLARPISRHLVGPNHKPSHHRMVGLALMFLGVVIARVIGEVGNLLVHIIADVIGASLHGLGLIPYIEQIETARINTTTQTTIKINESKTTTMIHTANQVADVFTEFRMAPTPIDQFEEVGRQRLVNKMEPFINSQAPVEFVMLGFPMKSMNTRDKVLGKLPDMAEQVAMENFAAFNARIKQVYAPGAKITLISDGYVFNDVMDVADGVVTAYEEVAKDMSKIAPVEWYDLRDFYSSKLTMEAMRHQLTQQFGITDLELERRILVDPDVNYLYRGMIKFMEGDLAIRNYPSRNQLHRAAKQTAKEMMFRNEAYSALVRDEFKDSIRLSMHPSINNGAKYSFQLIPGTKAWTSPWHAALLVEGPQDYATIHRKDAEQAGHRLIYKDGRPWNFVPNK